MRQLHLGRVGAIAARTALVTTAIVLGVYVAVAVVVVAIVQHNLTADIDTRLTSSLQSIGTQAPRHEPGGPDEHRGFAPPPDQGPSRFGPELLVWTVHPDGSVDNDRGATLPADQLAVTAPITATVNGADVRLAGATLGTQRVVVGQSMEGVYSTRAQIVTAELLVGPVLLTAVFLGALAIGRRVGAPIEQARRRQMEFTADASHELRTPLSVIEAQTQLALAQDRDPEWYRRAFRRVDVESGRIRRLVEDLLWLARFDATAAGPGSEPVDLGTLARGAAERFSAVAEARGLALTVAVGPGDDPPVVTAPPEWLDRLLGVLLDNACKYSPEGGSVRVLTAVDGSRVRLVVEDSGPGIPVEERSRVFDRFHRATDTPGGAGLGLAIADAVVRGSGGRWEIGDAPGGGASMGVTWPRALSPSRGGAPSPARAAPSG